MYMSSNTKFDLLVFSNLMVLKYHQKCDYMLVFLGSYVAYILLLSLIYFFFFLKFDGANVSSEAYSLLFLVQCCLYPIPS